MGYGSHALEALDSFYSGKLLNLDEASQAVQAESFVQASKVSKVRPILLTPSYC
jgi:N-acetyltransferase 10